MVAVLCARRDSVYKSLSPSEHRLDVYDADRDAFSFRGGVPVVCHPPCRGWGALRRFAKPTQAELDLGPFCVSACRANGGVLEHPAGSALWAALGLPRPGQPPSLEGWTLDVSQRWWGHQAEKRSWLFIVGVLPQDLPTIPFSLDPPSRAVTWSRSTTLPRLRRLTPADRERTPPEFARWLLNVAKLVRGAGT